jgi:hypothetical protein
MLGATFAGIGWRKPRSLTPLVAYRREDGRPWWHRFGPITASPPSDVKYTGPPPWTHPPEDELGVAVPVRAILESDWQFVVGLIDCVAFSTGFEFTITVRTRREMRPEDMGFGPPAPYGPDRSEKELRVGVQFADGRMGFTGNHPGPDFMAQWKLHAEGGAPDPADGPIISPRSGGGGGKRYDMRYFVWPLPPQGNVTFVCEWPAVGLAPAAHDVDATPIRQAGAASTKIWPDP